MKCSYHPTSDSADFCKACSKPLCAQCSHQIKGRVFCQDCLVRGAEWAATMGEFRIPADAPKRAALCALIPGMGAVYNSEYLKGITFFAVFAALVMMGDRIDGVFGFGAFAFLVFSMFDAYRTAEARARMRMRDESTELNLKKDRTIVAWGMFLIVLGFVFLLQNIIPYQFLNRMWPLVFILLGGYLVYRSMKDTDDGTHQPNALTERKEEF